MHARRVRPLQSNLQQAGRKQRFRQIRFTFLARNPVTRRSTRQQTNDLVGIDESTAAGLHHLALVVPGGLQWSEMRLPPREFHVAAGRIRDHDFE